MKILITGAGGYIGSFMVKRLLERGDEVIAVDNLERGRRGVIDRRAEFIQGDVGDSKLLNNVFSENSIDSVIHFAGLISMSESMKKPEIYFENNTFASLKLIDVAVKNKVKKFIFSSTAGVYGNPQEVPIPEDHPTNPTNPYGESKLMFENILSWYQKIFDLSFISLRYFNAAGASLDGSLGENHSPESHIIPLAIKSILENKEFNLFGTDYKTPDGTCVRDYIHVVDLIESHVLALNKLENNSGGFFYNVGTGKGYSNKEVLQMIEKVSNQKINIVEKEKRPGDADQLIADSKKINDELKFAPKYSDLETIIKTAWQWHKKQN